MYKAVYFKFVIIQIISFTLNLIILANAVQSDTPLLSVQHSPCLLIQRLLG